MNQTRCGYVAIIGRPNVGKSTLLNQILGKKISITSARSQTTRHRIYGIKTQENIQMIFVDTPGLQQETRRDLNRHMNRVAKNSIKDVEVIVFVVDAVRWMAEDEMVYEQIKHATIPVILVLNKIDTVVQKETLLPHMMILGQKMGFVEVIPLSAKTGFSVDVLENIIARYMPESPYFFPPDQITDKSDHFLVAEIIREKLFRNLHEELPHAVNVEIEKFEIENNSIKKSKEVLHISAIIWVERESQKGIVIGEKGTRLKEISIQARTDIEKYMKTPVFLQCWVKVKQNWSDNQQALQDFGYGE